MVNTNGKDMLVLFFSMSLSILITLQWKFYLSKTDSPSNSSSPLGQ
jgi:hypothetical protein